MSVIQLTDGDAMDSSCITDYAQGLDFDNGTQTDYFYINNAYNSTPDHIKVTGDSNASSEYNYSSCYYPGDVENFECHTNRAGQAMFGCFPAVGQTINNCRSSCVVGHPQDFNFTLNDPDYDNSTELPIAERGVELYENYGMDQNVSKASGRYGEHGGDDVQCINDLGRKVTLYGNLTYKILVYGGSGGKLSDIYPQVYFQKDIVAPGKCVIHTLTIQKGDSDRYNYFGNRGIKFSFVGKTRTYTIGKIESLPEVGFGTGDIIGAPVDHLIYFIIDKGCYGDSFAVPEGNNTGSNNPYLPDNSGCPWKTDGIAPMFPPSFLDYYFRQNTLNKDQFAYSCSSGHQSEGFSNTPFDCVATGVKSIYIPPHMKINQIRFNKLSLIGNSNQSTDILDSPITYEDSKYFNGTFHALTSSSGYPYTSGDSNIENSPKTKIPIPAGGLFQISVVVRQDDAFYNKYVKPASNKNSTIPPFAPEILLIPGILQGISLPGQMNSANASTGTFNKLQTFLNPNMYWSSENPYWTSDFGRVLVDTRFQPHNNLYGLMDSPPAPGTRTLPAMVYDPNTGTYQCTNTPTDGVTVDQSTIVNKLKGIFNKAEGDLRDTITTIKNKLSGKDIPNHTGQFRIKRFDVINGVYSLEWLYVLWYCAFMGRKNISYDSTTQSYVTNSCTANSGNTCGWECFNYRDDYNYDVDTGSEPNADTVMKAYCGIRNLTICYARWKTNYANKSNECACVVARGICPTQFNPSLCDTDKSNTSTYVTANQKNGCSETEICNYCNSVNTQIIFGNFANCGNNNSFDNNQNTITQDGVCGDSQCNYYYSDGSSTSQTSSNSSSQSDLSGSYSSSSINWALVIFIIIIAVIVISLAAIGVIRYMKNRKQ